MKRIHIKRFKIKLTVSDKTVLTLSYLPAITVFLLIIGSNFGLPLALSISIGGSMYPTIQSGDMNILLSTSSSSIKPGDIAVYVRNGVYVVHRVERIENNTVIFKGDNNVNTDSPVPINNVKYKVLATISPTIWVPFMSIFLVISAFIPQIYLRRKYGEGYTVHTLAILALFIVMTSTLSSTTFVDRGYDVKPAPAPKIVSVTKLDENHVLVKFNFDPVKVTCKNGQCIKIAPNTVKLYATGSGSVWIYATLPTVFNTTAIFVINIS